MDMEVQQQQQQPSPSSRVDPTTYINPDAPYAKPGPFDDDLPPPLDYEGRPLPPSDNPLNPFANMQLVPLADRKMQSLNRENVSKIREYQAARASTEEEAKAAEAAMLERMGITDPVTGEIRVASLTDEKDVELLAQQKGGVFVRRDESRGGKRCLYPDASAAQVSGGAGKITKICLKKEDVPFDTHGIIPFKMDVISQCQKLFIGEIERVVISFPVLDVPIYASSLLLLFDGMQHDTVTSVVTALKTYMLAIKMISMDERVGKSRKEASFKRIISLFQDGRLSRDEFSAFLSSVVPTSSAENYWSKSDPLSRYDNATLCEDDMIFAKRYTRRIDASVYDIDLIEAREGIVEQQATIVGGLPQPSGYSDDYMKEFEEAKESLTHHYYGGREPINDVGLDRILSYGFDLLALYESTLLRLLEQIIPKEMSGDFVTKRELPPSGSIHPSVLSVIQSNKDTLAKARAPEDAQLRWEPIPQKLDPPYVSDEEYRLFVEFIDSNSFYLPVSDGGAGQNSSTDRGAAAISAPNGHTTNNGF